VVVAAGCLVALAVRIDRRSAIHDDTRADALAPRPDYAASVPGDPA
jgi:hypothetical protein